MENNEDFNMMKEIAEEVGDDFTMEDFNNMSEEEIEDFRRLYSLSQLPANSLTANELVYELSQLEGIDVKIIKWYEKPFYDLYIFLYNLKNKIMNMR